MIDSRRNEEVENVGSFQLTVSVNATDRLCRESVGSSRWGRTSQSSIPSEAGDEGRGTYALY